MSMSKGRLKSLFDINSKTRQSRYMKNLKRYQESVFTTLTPQRMEISLHKSSEVNPRPVKGFVIDYEKQQKRFPSIKQDDLPIHEPLGLEEVQRIGMLKLTTQIILFLSCFAQIVSLLYQ